MTHEATGRDANRIEATIELFNRVRAQTMRIVAPLEIEDYVVQTAEFMSPPRWHIGHTSWFFETLLQTCLPGYRVYNEDYLYYFNSYYEGFGQRIEKSLRGTRSRPTVKETVRYRNYVDEAMTEFLKKIEARPDFDYQVVAGDLGCVDNCGQRSRVDQEVLAHGACRAHIQRA